MPQEPREQRVNPTTGASQRGADSTPGRPKEQPEEQRAAQRLGQRPRQPDEIDPQQAQGEGSDAEDESTGLTRGGSSDEEEVVERSEQPRGGMASGPRSGASS